MTRSEKTIKGCEGCKLLSGERKSTGGIIELDSYWMLNHSSTPDSYLGWLILQPKSHRMDLSDLTPSEAKTLGPNIKRISRALRNYWGKEFPTDYLERIYVVYFFESAFNDKGEQWHLHIHLIPRTVKLGKDGRGKYRPWDVAAWKINKLSCSFNFPYEYRTRNKFGYKINAGKVEELMRYLRIHLSIAS